MAMYPYGKSRNPEGRPPKIGDLIRSLGYCCEWSFMRLFKKSTLIAARLGVSRKTVWRLKVKVREGTVGCTHAENCLYQRICKRL